MTARDQPPPHPVDRQRRAGFYFFDSDKPQPTSALLSAISLSFGQILKKRICTADCYPDSPPTERTAHASPGQSEAPSRVTRPFHLKGLKARSNKGETQQIESRNRANREIGGPRRTFSSLGTTCRTWLKGYNPRFFEVPTIIAIGRADDDCRRDAMLVAQPMTLAPISFPGPSGWDRPTPGPAGL